MPFCRSIICRTQNYNTNGPHFLIESPNEQGTINEPDKVIITVIPVATPPSKVDSQTIYDLTKDILKNPLGITNSVESSHKMIDVITDSNRDNDRIVCDLIGVVDGTQMNNIQEIIKC